MSLRSCLPTRICLLALALAFATASALLFAPVARAGRPASALRSTRPAAPRPVAPAQAADTARGPALLVPHAAPADTAPESPPAPFLDPTASRPDTSARARLTEALAQFRLGVAFENDGNDLAALASYRRAAMLSDTLRDASYRAGLLFLKRGQTLDAVKSFDREVRRHPDHDRARRELGLGLARLGRGPRAITELVRLTREHPRDDENWQALGFAYQTAGRPQDAEGALKRAIALGPQRAAEHRDLGVVLAFQGRNAEARAEYRRAMALDPSDGSVWVNLANLDSRRGRYEEALENYRAAEARDSGSTLALRGQIEVLTALDREGEAGEVYRRWLERVPADDELRLRAVLLFQHIDRGDVALEVAREGVRRNRHSADAHLVLATALRSAGDLRGALAELRTGQRMARDPATLAQARRMFHDLLGATADSIRAAAADSTSPKAAPDSASDPEGKP